MAANFSKEILLNRVGRQEVERSKWGKTEGSLVCVYPITWTPFFSETCLIGDSVLQGQTRKDVGMPQVSWAEVLMQGDVEIMFAFLFRTVASCQNTHLDRFYHKAAVDPPSYLCGRGQMWPVSSPSPPPSTILDDRCQGQPAFHLSFLVKALPWAQILTFTVWNKVLMNKQRFELEQAWSKCQVHLCPLLHLHRESGLDPVWNLQCLRLYGSGET